MQIRERMTLPVLDMNGEGVGICKKDGAVIFVPHTVTGDTAEIEIENIEKNFAKGICRWIVMPSALRRKAECPYYQQCGGCSLQHITREAEMTVKENTVRQALRRMHLDQKTEIFRPIRAGEEIGYRNKAVFHIDKQGKIGYYARETHDVMEGSYRCRLLPEIFVRIAERTEQIFQIVPEYRKWKPESLYLRCNQGQKCSVCLQTADPLTPEMEKDLQGFVQILQRELGENLNGVLHCDHPKGKYAVPHYTVLAGERYLYETYHGLQMRISPEGFCQVNHAGAEILAETVTEFACMTMGEASCTAADLYCGSGFFGLHLAKNFPAWQIVGMEISKDSIRDAEVNKALNGFDNIRFACGDAADVDMGKAKPDFVVIDPPRAGCSAKMCRQLLQLSPVHIAYVSCNPQTLARDLAQLTGNGYEIRVVQPVDMFPGTGHVETVVCLSREKVDDSIS